MPIWVFVIAGIASVFQPDTMYGDGLHVCAANDIPISTHIEIVNDDNHRSTDCIVVGVGPFVPGRVLDVSPSVRDALGMTDLADVRVYRVIGQVPRCASTPQPETCKTPPQSCVLDLPKVVIVKC